MECKQWRAYLYPQYVRGRASGGFRKFLGTLQPSSPEEQGEGMAGHPGYRARRGARAKRRWLTGSAQFVLTMAEGASEVMEEVVDRVTDYARPVPVQTMLDVGGAVGHMALRFADQGMDAILVDRADVIPVAREHLGEKAEMIACVAADFTEELPVGPFGVAYLGNVCHIYGPETNRKLLQRVHSVLAPGGTVAVREFVWERSERAPMFAVNMLQATEEGGVWREEQYRGWLEEAGFGRVEVQDLEYSENQLVLGKRQGAR